MKHQKAMQSLPSGYLPENNYISLYINGQYTQLYLYEQRRVAESRESLSLTSSDPLAIEIRDHRSRTEKVEQDFRKAEGQARAVLASVTTLQKLLDVWPEVEAFTKDFGAEGKPVTALALPIKTLNAALGLPPGGA
jgi:hypothetical protein